MDTQDWIKIGIISAHRWPGVNATTTVQRCECNSIVLPVFEPTLRFDNPRDLFGRPPSIPLNKEKVVLDALILDSGNKIRIGYSERTNSLWINED